MSLESLNVNGINMDVYYTCHVERDPLGTRDSPTEYYIDITEIEIGADTQNVYEILPEYIKEQIIDKLIEIEGN